MNDACPICGGPDCVTYPLMLERWAAGRDREHWRRIHDVINGAPARTPPPLPPIPDNPTPAPGVRLGGCCGG